MKFKPPTQDIDCYALKFGNKKIQIISQTKIRRSRDIFSYKTDSLSVIKRRKNERERESLRKSENLLVLHAAITIIVYIDFLLLFMLLLLSVNETREVRAG